MLYASATAGDSRRTAHAQRLDAQQQKAPHRVLVNRPVREECPEAYRGQELATRRLEKLRY